MKHKKKFLWFEANLKKIIEKSKILTFFSFSTKTQAA